jgi:long-chain fatty acid transport protein
MRRFHVWLAVGVTAGLVAGPRAALAQGYGVYEHGSCAMGRAGTGVASPCSDASTIFFNPAGLALMTQQMISAGGTLIIPSGGFENENTGVRTDLNDRIYPVPHLYYQRRVNDRLAAGFGVFAPYGLETDWPTDFEGRFLGYKSVVQAIYFQPTLAVKLGNRISFGAGIDITHIHVELHQHADLAEVALPPPAPPGATFANLGIPSGTDFADAEVSGNAWNIGASFGILWQATDRLSLGAKYLSRQKVEISEGTVSFNQLPTGITLAAGNPFGVPAGTPLDVVLAPGFLDDSLLGTQGGSTTITMPDQIVVGAAFQLTPKIKLLFDWQRVNWEVFDQLVLQFERAGTRTIVEDFRPSNGFRLGGEFAWNPTTTFRGGFLTHSAAAPAQTVTPNLPEGKRSEITLGFGTRLTNSIRVDLAYQYIDQADRRGRTTDGGLAVPTTAVNNGLYTFSAHLIGATVALAF